MEGSGSDDLSKEYEEEGGEGGGPPAQMLCRGVFDSWKNDSILNLAVDG